MLLLKRRVGESIVIGESIRVSVVEVRGGGVRLAIDAPADVSVYRAELLEKLGEENMRARVAEPRRRGSLTEPTVTFPQGIMGMGEHHEFVVYDVNEQQRALVARDDPTLCLLLTDPVSLDPSYPVERAFSRYPYQREELAIAVVLTYPSDGSTPTANMAAPMVIGLESRTAAQVLLDDPALSFRAPLTLAPVEVHAP